MRLAIILTALLLLFSVCAGAQVTVSNTSLTFSGRAQMGQPFAQRIVLGGTGNVNYTPYSGGCTGGSGADCQTAQANFCVGSSVNANSTSGQKILNLSSVAGFAPGQTVAIGFGTARLEYGTIAPGGVGASSLTLLANLQFTHSGGGQNDGVDTDPCVVPTLVGGNYPVPNVLWVWFSNWNSLSVRSNQAWTMQLLAPGGSIVGGGLLNLTVSVIANNQSSTTFGSPGAVTNCSNPTPSQLWDTANCIVTPAGSPTAPNTFTAPFTAGANYVDGNFGTSITAIGNPPTEIGPAADSEVGAFNKDGTLIWSGTYNSAQFHTPSGAGVGTLVYTNVNYVDADATFSAVDPLVYYYTDGLVVHKVTLNGAGGSCTTPGVCVDTILGPYPGPTGAVGFQRDTQINAQNLWAKVVYVPLTIASITTGTTTIAAITGTIPASVAVGSTFYITGNGTCPALTGLLTVTSVSSPNITFAVDTTSGCGSYNGLATFNADMRTCVANLTSFATFCSAADSGAQGNPDAVNISSLNTPNGLYYVMVGYKGSDNNVHESRMWSYDGASTVTPLGTLPMLANLGQTINPPHFHFTGPHCNTYADATTAGLCLSGPDTHMTIVGVPDGLGGTVQFMALGVGQFGPNIADVEFLRLDTGDNMVVDHEVGGGAYHSFVTFSGSDTCDDHIGAALNKPVAVISFNDCPTSPTPPSVQIASVSTPGGVPNITSVQVPTFSNGDTVQISAVVGVTGLNNTGASPWQFCTVAGLSGSSWTCSNISTASGSSSGSGVAAKAFTPVVGNHYREVDVIDLTNLITGNSTAVHRQALSRSIGYTNNYHESGTYGTQAHAVLSYDGTVVAWNTNFGLSDVDTAVSAASGYGSINLSRTSLPTAQWVVGIGDGPFSQDITITGTGSGLSQGSCTGSGCSALLTSFCTAGIVNTDSFSGQPTLFLNSTVGFVAGQFVRIAAGTAREEELLINNVTSGISITFTRNLAFSHTAAQGDTAEADPCVATTISPAILHVYWDGYTNTGYAPGTYPISFPVNSTPSCSTCTVTGGIQVFANHPASIQNGGGTSVGCTNPAPSSFPFYPDPASCTTPFPPDMNPGGVFNLPARGSTYSDGVFGTTNIRNVGGGMGRAVARNLPTDAIVTTFNSDNSIIGTQVTTGGQTYLTSTSAGTDICALSSTLNLMDPVSSNVYYTAGNSTVVLKNSINLGTCVDTQTAVYTYPGSATALSTGGDSELTQDGWFAFQTTGGSDNYFGIVNVNSGTAFLSGTQPYPSWFDPTGQDRAAQVLGGCESSNNKRYGVAMFFDFTTGASIPNQVYSLNCAGGTSLVSEYTMPTQFGAIYAGYFGGAVCTPSAAIHSWCHQAGHNTVVMVGGHAYYVEQYSSSHPFMEYSAYARLDKGTNLFVPVEAGGGMWAFAVNNNGQVDTHTACATNAPACIVSEDSNPTYYGGGFATWGMTITSVSNATPRVVTYVEGDTTISNGSTVVLGGVDGCTSINGPTQKWVVAGLNTGAKTFQLQGSTAGAACTAATGGVAVAINPTPYAHNGEVIVFDLTNLATQNVVAHRQFKHRSYSMRGNIGGPIGYYDQPHCVISRDGTMGGCETGNGLPDTLSTVVFPTGYNATCSITPTSLPGGVVGTMYSQPINNVFCGASSWSISPGTLPTGLSGCTSGSGSSCTISGTPAAPGTSNFTVNYNTASDPLTIVISGLPSSSVTVNSRGLGIGSAVVH